MRAWYTKPSRVEIYIHVGGQFFRIIHLKIEFPREEKCFCSWPPKWPPWRHVQSWPQLFKSWISLSGGGGGGGHSSFTQPYSYPYSDFFFKCPLRCSLAQANLFAVFMVASVSVIDLWQYISRQLFRRSCFMVLLKYSSWVVWGQKMCALKSPMSHVLSIIPLQVFFGTKTWGLCPPAPPPMSSMEKNTMHSTNVLFTKRNIR